jgi:hypothetical protein
VAEAGRESRVLVAGDHPAADAQQPALGQGIPQRPAIDVVEVETTDERAQRASRRLE